MTEAAAQIADDLVADVQAALSKHRWMTPREVYQCVGNYSHVSIRQALRGLAEAGKVEDRIGGAASRPVREYRAWK